MDFFPKFGGENTGLYGTLKAGNMKEGLRRFLATPPDPIPAVRLKRGKFFFKQQDS
jgi:hypothetical protein